jgi:hypothetical protein
MHTHMVLPGQHQDGAFRPGFGNILVLFLLSVGKTVVFIKLDLTVLLEVFFIGKDNADSASGNVSETDVEPGEITPYNEVKTVGNLG